MQGYYGGIAAGRFARLLGHTEVRPFALGANVLMARRNPEFDDREFRWNQSSRQHPQFPHTYPPATISLTSCALVFAFPLAFPVAFVVAAGGNPARWNPARFSRLLCTDECLICMIAIHAVMHEAFHHFTLHPPGMAWISTLLVRLLVW